MSHNFAAEFKPRVPIREDAALRVASLFAAAPSVQRLVFDLLRPILPGAGLGGGAIACPAGYVNDDDQVTVFARWVPDQRAARSDHIPFTDWAAAVRTATKLAAVPPEADDEADGQVWAELVDLSIILGDQLLDHLHATNDTAALVLAEFRTRPRLSVSRVEVGSNGRLLVVLGLSGKNEEHTTILRDLPVRVEEWVAAVKEIS